MSEITEIVAGIPLSDDPYRDLDEQTRALFTGETDFIANCANLSSLIFHRLTDLNWCGFYLFRGDELVLGPFQGRIACIRIPLGRGVCGAAARERRTIVVPDVTAFAGHIACDPASRSEIVVPLLQDERLVGVLDIDSPSPNRFGEHDVRGLERLTSLLVESSEPFVG